MSAQPALSRNVELKVSDLEPDRSLAACRALGAEEIALLHQRDTYFPVPHGRLKLREEPPGPARLVQYERPDVAGARESRYRLVEAPEPESLTAALEAAHGVLVVVEKDRRLFLWQGVRIHLDRVAGLGTFLELEAVAGSLSDLTTERRRVDYLIRALEITEETLVPEGYAELLLAHQLGPAAAVTEPSSTRTPANKGRRLPAELLSGEEVRALLRACSSRAPTGVRNRALIAVLYRGGLRISEALALHAKDVDQAVGTVTVLHGKGDQRRTVGMDPAAFALLERWLDKRRALGLFSGRRPIFCTLEGRAIDSSYVRRLLPRLAARAGIEKRVHAHGLRHAHAAELAAEGLPVNVVQQQLGHGSLATTDRYLRHIVRRGSSDAVDGVAVRERVILAVCGLEPEQVRASRS